MTSAATQTVRSGVIVRLEGEDGFYGLGEIAPLRNGKERNIATLLQSLERRLAGIDVDEIPNALGRLDARKDVAAAIRCGLDIAACDLMAKAASISVAEFLDQTPKAAGAGQRNDFRGHAEDRGTGCAPRGGEWLSMRQAQGRDDAHDCGGMRTGRRGT